MPARLISGFLVALLLLIAAPAAAVQPALAQAEVEFQTSDATVTFPESIEFTVTAHTTVDVERVQIFWRAAGAAATTMADAEFDQNERVEATYLADMTVRYLPPGLDIDYYWVLTDSQGVTHRSDAQSLAYIDSRFEWESLQAGLVNVWWYQGDEGYASEVAHSANRTLLMLENDFGVTTDQPVRIMMYGNDQDFASALRPNSADWIGGVAYSSLSLIIANVRPGTNAQREIDRMIPHEVSHVAMHHASRNPYNTPPPWLDEGLATYVQETGDPRLAPALDRAVREGRLIQIGALRSSFPLDPDQALLSYAQSLSIVTYLVDTYGHATVGELATIYRQEVTHDQAVEQVLGISIDELDSDWKAWLGYAGDRQIQPGTEAAQQSRIGITWYAGIFGAALLFTGGFIALLFWRTRKYADNEDDEAPPEMA